MLHPKLKYLREPFCKTYFDEDSTENNQRYVSRFSDGSLLGSKTERSSAFLALFGAQMVMFGDDSILKSCSSRNPKSRLV